MLLILKQAVGEEHAAALDFANHAPSIECFVQRRADGKVATLFKIESESPWRDNLAAEEPKDYVAEHMNGHLKPIQQLVKHKFPECD